MPPWAPLHTSWLKVLRRIERDLPCEAVLHLGHGAIADPDVLTRQAGYLREFRRQVRDIGGGARTLRPEQIDESGAGPGRAARSPRPAAPPRSPVPDRRRRTRRPTGRHRGERQA